MQITHGLSARRADHVLGLSRSARHYVPRPCEDGSLIEAMQAHIAANPGHGFGLLHACALKPLGWGKTRSWLGVHRPEVEFAPARQAPVA
ncbi:hypothetical protein STPYR_11097 [uncultured Stenotrophomonas sp.]|uniref:Uncharacterized protein n=1 Tax=uncultured Stenotrophomonas sp. TaxID=165438 RepID=A0A1Y5Q855_9GAMM|nr:hypothetical protein STPYR_11097 [uncultured Stenotrophomonas sp.]